MKRKTNVQKITHLMTLNPGGPLAQAFILEAVHQYAAEVLAAARPDETRRPMDLLVCGDGPAGAMPWINPAAWHDTARAVVDQLTAMEAAK